MKSRNRLLYNLIKFIPFYLIGILSLLVVDIFQIFIPKILSEIIDGIKSGAFTINDIFYNSLKILLISIIILIGRILWRLFIFGSSRKIEYNIRNDLFKHIESLTQNFYNKNKTGDLMAHFTNDAEAVRMAIGPGFMMAFDAVVMTILVIINMIFYVNLNLTLLSIIPLPIIVIGGILLGKRLTERFKEKQEAFGKMTDFSQEAFTGIRVIKAFVQEKNHLKEFLKVNKSNYDKNIKVVKLYGLLFPIVEIISSICFLIALIYGGYLAIINKISLGKFIAFYQYLGMLIWPMIAMGWCINIFSQGISSQRRIKKIFNEKPEISDKNKPVSGKIKYGRIKIKNLTFRYIDTKEPQLKNINLSIDEGKILGIVGKTASGKSSLINLLVRLYDSKKGSIFIDGVDIHDVPLHELRKFIIIVPQDNVLFSDTIANNIAFGSEETNKVKIEEFARIACIHENILEFPKKYETIIGERGVTLSGGQKQRISIARAILLNPKILILDDSLSSVDTDTENKLLKNLKAIRKNKTTIIISHRISTIQEADKIIFIENGKISEEGTHKDLLMKKDKYYNMYQKQQIEKQMEGKQSNVGRTGSFR